MLTHPIAVGRGLRLSVDAAAPIPLKLIQCEAFTSGVVYVVYGPADKQ